MTNAFNDGQYDYARKDTLAILDGVGISLPEFRVYRTDGSVDDVGIPKPTAAPTASAGAAGNPNGSYIYKVTFKDSVKGYFGQGSDTFNVTVTNQKVVIDLTPITNEADHSAVDKIQIWRSLAGGSVLFLVDTVDSTDSSYTDDSSDATISLNQTLPVAEQAYKVPVKDTYGWILRGRDRLFVGGAADYFDDDSEYRNKMAWVPIEPNTGVPFPEAWPDENVVTFENGGEHLRSAAMIGESMAVFEENETWWWTWLDNPDAQTGNGNLEPMGLGRGTVTFKSKVVVDGMAWCLDRQGIWGYQGGERVFEIGGRLQAEFDRINWDEVAQIHAAYDDKRIYFFVPLDADTEIKYAFVLDRKSLQTRQGARWWLYYIPQGARDSTHYVLGPSSTAIDFNMVGKRVVHIITTEGYEQVFSEGVYSDGVHPEITHEGTLTGATTTVMTDGTGTFVVGNANLEGVYAWIDDPRSPDPVPVASSTSTTFTLKNALGYTPAVGTAYKLGKITSFWRSGQLDLGGPEVMKHFSQVAVVLSPKPEEGEIVITTRHGRLGEFIAGKSEANRTGWELVQYARGAKLKSGGRWGTTGNREGYTEVPIFGRDARYVEIEFFNEDYLPFELIGYYIQAVNFVVE